MFQSYYRIADEPQPRHPWCRWVVSPIWPLGSILFGGIEIAWLWLLVNSFAMGSYSRWQELMWVSLGMLGLGVGVMPFVDQSLFLKLILIVWQVGILSIVLPLQMNAFNLYRYNYGVRQSGFTLLLIVLLLSVLWHLR
ncbi:MAG: hypothetical protein SVR94_05605 [Pseudomonadota bacterium]|nr:hypothetical protein [Pseudomonadota bacterium]